MSDDLTDFFMGSIPSGQGISRETRAFMTDMLGFESVDPLLSDAPDSSNSSGNSSGNSCDLSGEPSVSSGSSGSSPFSSSSLESSISLPTELPPTLPRPPLPGGLPTHTHLSSIIPCVVNLVARIHQELQTNLAKLLSLNPSRREGIASHLDRLAGAPTGSPQNASSHSHSHSHSNNPHHSNHASASSSEASARLRKWIEEPRNANQNTALKAYFEEVALISLGQAMLLKSWSDRGIRKWSESDLGRLNWALSTALRPHVPLDREGWQITRPNLYSWYNPSPSLQKEIWGFLESWKLLDENPDFLASVLKPVRRAQPENADPQGFDTRFYKSIWDYMNTLDFCGTSSRDPIRRSKVVFSPTLREGAIARMAPNTLQWIGLESSPFLLMLAELMQIWWGPSPPPLWALGTGLEVHSKDQLALALSSSKPSVTSRITEMEACDAAFVFEELTVKTQGRNPNSIRFKEQVESLPYFKKLRATGTSLGSLQACVALSKLRPGGYLWWARQEALSPKEGHEVLNFLLERAKLCHEWDFSELEHSLPSTTPLYPKYLYLFQKETHIEARMSHRPTQHCIQGQMRSHVELPLVLEDAFSATVRPSIARGHWKRMSHQSPTPQKDWIDQWPDPTSHSTVRMLDQLRQSSLPLANFTTIRPTSEMSTKGNGSWSIQLTLKGFWLVAEYDQDGRRLATRPLPQTGEEKEGSGFLVLVSDESWLAPLCAYLRSELVQKWLDHQVERRGERWILSEQVVKWIPVPRKLLSHIGVPAAQVPAPQNQSFSALSLATSPGVPPKWEALFSEIAYQPKHVLEELKKEELKKDELENDGLKNEDLNEIHISLFVRTARVLEQFHTSQNRLFSMVTPDGRLKWRELMEALPKGECVSVSLHPKIRLSGSLPPHLPIGRIDRVKSPMPGILLATESGFSLHMGSENTMLMNILWEQLNTLSHPTWNELLHYLLLPRKIEIAETTALDILRSHGEQMIRFRELQSLLATCRLF